MEKYPPIDKQFQIMVLSGGRLSVTEDNKKRLKQMNKYKIAMSCGKGSALLKLLKRLGLILLLSYQNTLRLTTKSRSVFVGGGFNGVKRQDEF